MRGSRTSRSPSVSVRRHRNNVEDLDSVYVNSLSHVSEDTKEPLFASSHSQLFPKPPKPGRPPIAGRKSGGFATSFKRQRTPAWKSFGTPRAPKTDTKVWDQVRTGLRSGGFTFQPAPKPTESRVNQEPMTAGRSPLRTIDPLENLNESGRRGLFDSVVSKLPFGSGGRDRQPFASDEKQNRVERDPFDLLPQSQSGLGVKEASPSRSLFQPSGDLPSARAESPRRTGISSMFSNIIASGKKAVPSFLFKPYGGRIEQKDEEVQQGARKFLTQEQKQNLQPVPEEEKENEMQGSSSSAVPVSRRRASDVFEQLVANKGDLPPSLYPELDKPSPTQPIHYPTADELPSLSPPKPVVKPAPSIFDKPVDDGSIFGKPASGSIFERPADGSSIFAPQPAGSSIFEARPQDSEETVVPHTATKQPSINPLFKAVLAASAGKKKTKKKKQVDSDDEDSDDDESESEEDDEAANFFESLNSGKKPKGSLFDTSNKQEPEKRKFRTKAEKEKPTTSIFGQPAPAASSSNIFSQPASSQPPSTSIFGQPAKKSSIWDEEPMSNIQPKETSNIFGSFAKPVKPAEPPAESSGASSSTGVTLPSIFTAAGSAAVAASSKKKKKDEEENSDDESDDDSDDSRGEDESDDSESDGSYVPPGSVEMEEDDDEDTIDEDEDAGLTLESEEEEDSDEPHQLFEEDKDEEEEEDEESDSEEEETTGVVRPEDLAAFMDSTSEEAEDDDDNDDEDEEAQQGSPLERGSTPEDSVLIESSDDEDEEEEDDSDDDDDNDEDEDEENLFEEDTTSAVQEISDGDDSEGEDEDEDEVDVQPAAAQAGPAVAASEEDEDDDDEDDDDDDDETDKSEDFGSEEIVIDSDGEERIADSVEQSEEIESEEISDDDEELEQDPLLLGKDAEQEDDSEEADDDDDEGDVLGQQEAIDGAEEADLEELEEDLVEEQAEERAEGINLTRPEAISDAEIKRLEKLDAELQEKQEPRSILAGSSSGAPKRDSVPKTDRKVMFRENLIDEKEISPRVKSSEPGIILGDDFENIDDTPKSSEDATPSSDDVVGESSPFVFRKQPANEQSAGSNATDFALDESRPQPPTQEELDDMSPRTRSRRVARLSVDGFVYRTTPTPEVASPEEPDDDDEDQEPLTSQQEEQLEEDLEDGLEDSDEIIEDDDAFETDNTSAIEQATDTSGEIDVNPHADTSGDITEPLGTDPSFLMDSEPSGLTSIFGASLASASQAITDFPRRFSWRGDTETGEEGAASTPAEVTQSEQTVEIQQEVVSPTKRKFRTQEQKRSASPERAAASSAPAQPMSEGSFVDIFRRLSGGSQQAEEQAETDDATTVRLPSATPTDTDTTVQLPSLEPSAPAGEESQPSMWGQFKKRVSDVMGSAPGEQPPPNTEVLEVVEEEIQITEEVRQEGDVEVTEVTAEVSINVTETVTETVPTEETAAVAEDGKKPITLLKVAQKRVSEVSSNLSAQDQKEDQEAVMANQTEGAEPPAEGRSSLFKNLADKVFGRQESDAQSSVRPDEDEEEDEQDEDEEEDLPSSTQQQPPGSPRVASLGMAGVVRDPEIVVTAVNKAEVIPADDESDVVDLTEEEGDTDEARSPSGPPVGAARASPSGSSPNSFGMAGGDGEEAGERSPARGSKRGFFDTVADFNPFKRRRIATEDDDEPFSSPRNAASPRSPITPEDRKRIEESAAQQALQAHASGEKYLEGRRKSAEENQIQEEQGEEAESSEPPEQDPSARPSFFGRISGSLFGSSTPAPESSSAEVVPPITETSGSATEVLPSLEGESIDKSEVETATEAAAASSSSAVPATKDDDEQPVEPRLSFPNLVPTFLRTPQPDPASPPKRKFRTKEQKESPDGKAPGSPSAVCTESLGMAGVARDPATTLTPMKKEELDQPEPSSSIGSSVLHNFRTSVGSFFGGGSASKKRPASPSSPSRKKAKTDDEPEMIVDSDDEAPKESSPRSLQIFGKMAKEQHLDSPNNTHPFHIKSGEVKNWFDQHNSHIFWGKHLESDPVLHLNGVLCGIKKRMEDPYNWHGKITLYLNEDGDYVVDKGTNPVPETAQGHITMNAQGWKSYLSCLSTDFADEGGFYSEEVIDVFAAWNDTFPDKCSGVFQTDFCSRWTQLSHQQEPKKKMLDEIIEKFDSFESTKPEYYFLFPFFHKDTLVLFVARHEYRKKHGEVSIWVPDNRFDDEKYKKQFAQSKAMLKMLQKQLCKMLEAAAESQGIKASPRKGIVKEWKDADAPDIPRADSPDAVGPMLCWYLHLLCGGASDKDKLKVLGATLRAAKKRGDKDPFVDLKFWKCSVTLAILEGKHH